MGFWILVVAFAFSIYFINRHFFSYWSNHGFPYKEPMFLLGIIGEMIAERKCVGEFFEKIYKRYKNLKLLGIYLSYKPALVVNDYQLMHDVMVKNFDRFHDRGTPVNEEVDPLTGHLFAIGGQKWRDLRVKLSPTFTSGKLKGMYPAINDCAKVLKTYIENSKKDGKNIFDSRDLLARFTTSVISSVAFGIENDCINHPDNLFRKMGLRIFESDFKRTISNIFVRFLPKLALYFKIKRIPQDIEDFFVSVVEQTINYRENNLDFQRKDFMQLLIQLKNQGYLSVDKTKDNDETTNVDDSDIKKLTFNEVVAQSFLFFVAGFETSSSTSNFCLFELSRHTDIQRRVQEEIDRVIKNANSTDITYDMLNEMKYLECCIDETLRKYPIVPVLTRICTNTCKLTGTDWTVEKGTLVFIPLLGLHRDPDIFEDPMDFKPERFMNSSFGTGKSNNSFYLPFGTGPRNCIGARMGKLQTKIALATILSKYSFILLDNTLAHGELEFDRKQFILTPKEKLMLIATSRK